MDGKVSNHAFGNKLLLTKLFEHLASFFALSPRSYSHTAVKLTLQELEAAAGAEGWVDVCKEPEGE